MHCCADALSSEIKWTDLFVSESPLGDAEEYAERRRKSAGKATGTPFIFPPSKNNELAKQTSDLHHQWRPALKALGIGYRPPYNCRHTYATMCLMSGMNPAFIAQQLGHSVQMLLPTYARWLNSRNDWDELNKLKTAPSVAQGQNQPPLSP
ncbi:hypothetical protein DBR00_10040 [Pseudomonas sp. HMWF032]|nr:hypothetical protein DBR00_10040 [Pseudomonas sp. HMWF032]PTT82538.1 hypothetical protein DBR41_13310 [Pseudomonas sp. HMWF010]